MRPCFHVCESYGALTETSVAVSPSVPSTAASAPPVLGPLGSARGLSLSNGPGISPDASQEEWFRKEVHSHDGQLRSYLRSSFPRVRDVDDLVQESYLRIWRRQTSQPVKFAKAFLFTIARRLALSWIRKDRNSATEACEDLDLLVLHDDGRSAADAASRAELVGLLIDAIDSLPKRCREVVILRKFKFLSARETAERLGVQEHTVEMQLARANARIRHYLQSRGIRTVLGRES